AMRKTVASPRDPCGGRSSSELEWERSASMVATLQRPAGSCCAPVTFQPDTRLIIVAQARSLHRNLRGAPCEDGGVPKAVPTVQILGGGGLSRGCGRRSCMQLGLKLEF